MSILLSRARSHHCRWIVCDAVPARSGTVPDLFGGARICGARPSFPTSYSAEHRLRVYAAAPAPSAPMDLAIARRAPPADTQPELTEIFG
jgi:hypothetical protein